MQPQMKLAVVALTVATAVSSAKAADLPARVAPAPYIVPLPVFTWTGAYFGINAGASFDNEAKYGLSNGNGITAANTGIGTNRPTSFKNSDDGFAAGGQIGYNYQFGGAGLGAAGNVGGFGLGGIVIGFGGRRRLYRCREDRQHYPQHCCRPSFSQ